MAITGIDTIDGKQIIAAGAVSAKSAEMAYNDENGNPITGYLTAVPTGTMNESAFGYDSDNKISSYNGSAFAGGSYQPSGNYIPYTAVDSTFNAFKTNSGLEITTSIGGALNTNFIDSKYIALLSINSNLGINNKSTLSTGSLKFQTKSDSAYVDREKIHKWDSASDYIQNNSATINEVNTSYQTNSGTYLTAHQDLSDYQTTAEMTAYLTAVPDTYLQNTDLEISDNKITGISGVPLAAGGGSTPTYDYTDNGLISAIDTSGLYATSALEAVSANVVKDHGTLGYDLSSYLTQNTSYFYWMPANSPWTTADYATGIFSPLQYSTGACLAMDNPNFKAYYKGNEWFVSNPGKSVGQMLRGEVHQSRGVHISGATTAGYGFNLAIGGVSGVHSPGSWKYGHAEDAALRAVSSCDMHESAFGYDASDNITAYNGSAFKAGDEFPQSATEAIETVTANSGAWGGSALPISAGPGVKVELVDNTLVFSNDETVLFETTALNVSAVLLSEPLSSFERFRLYPYQANAGYYNYGEFDYDTVRDLATGNNIRLLYSRSIGGNNPIQFLYGDYILSNDTNSITATSGVRRWFPASTAAGGSDSNNTYIRKVVGINRITGGN